MSDTLINDNDVPVCDCDYCAKCEPSIDTILVEVEFMRADFAKIQETLSAIQEVIEPAINDLKRSPIGKMMGL